MKEYILDEKYRYFSKTTSKGTQIKYKKGDYFYKINKNGNEGFVEYLISRLLKYSDLPDYGFVDYEYCKINGNLGCRSKNFLATSNEEFVSINSLYERLTGNTNLSDYLSLLSTPVERLNYILGIVESFGFYKQFFYDYLKVLLQLDLLISNIDRHAHNYGLIYNSVIGRFRICPIFDNGLSLDTNRLGNGASCTISGSFTEQVVAFGYPIKSAFKLDYKKVNSDLARIARLYGNMYEINILRDNMEKYKSIFSM